MADLTKVIKELTNEIDELNFKLQQNVMNTLKLSALIFQIKAGDLTIDDVFSQLEDNMDKSTFESMYHTYILKDILGPTFNLESDLKDDTFEEDNSSSSLNINN